VAKPILKMAKFSQFGRKNAKFLTLDQNILFEGMCLMIRYLLGLVWTPCLLSRCYVTSIYIPVLKDVYTPKTILLAECGLLQNIWPPVILQFKACLTATLRVVLLNLRLTKLAGRL